MKFCHYCLSMLVQLLNEFSLISNIAAVNFDANRFLSLGFMIVFGHLIVNKIRKKTIKSKENLKNSMYYQFDLR